MGPIIENNVQRIQELCQQFNVQRLHVFGSATNEKFNEQSDIDFLVKFGSININDYADNYFGFYYALERLFKRKIDLVSESALSNPYFIESVEESKKLIYDKRNQEVSV